MNIDDRNLVNDIVAQHRERMLNLKKYYPFFRLSETSFAWYKGGTYDNLDMGYILMAVLRFFIEENNFKEKKVSYPEYVKFMEKCLRRDFSIEADETDMKVLVDYIFDKIKNEGKPFAFTYYDPVDRVKKISRVKLLESHIEDGIVHYSISADGIEFYLDTKEIRDESKISVEQLLLEKMIGANDFKGGTAVVAKINEEVQRLWHRKNQVIDLMSVDVFSGVKAYREFFETGIRWFEEEQKLFAKNKELIETALEKTQENQGDEDLESFYRTTNEIYRLDQELKIAMNNHAQLIRECTDLGVKADEILRKSKLSRLRSRFDYANALELMEQKDDPSLLALVICPFLALNCHKSFALDRLEDAIGFRETTQEKAEQVTKEETVDVVFEDELAERRFARNTRTLWHILLGEIVRRGSFSLADYHEKVRAILGDAVVSNGDYYTFLIHLCEKKDYILTTSGAGEETFLDALIAGFMKEKEFTPFIGLHFRLVLAAGWEEELKLSEHVTVTNFRIERL